MEHAAYTEIAIVAPSSAEKGKTVSVTIKVTSIDTADHPIWTLCSAPEVGEHIIDKADIIGAGKTVSYSGSFIMPNKDAEIRVDTYYPYFKEWLSDAIKKKNVSLEAPVEEPEEEPEEVWNLAETIRGLAVNPAAVWTRRETITGLAINPIGRWLLQETITGLAIDVASRWILQETVKGLAINVIGRWILQETVKGLVVSVSGVPPNGFPPDEEEDEEEKEKDWLPWAIIGGVGAIAIMSKKEKGGKQ